MTISRFPYLAAAALWLLAPDAALSQAPTGKSPVDELPPHIRRVTWFGERADWSHDGKRILFLAKTFGDVYEVEWSTGILRPMTHHYFHAPNQYDEPEGIFPDGKHTLVECDRHCRKGPGHIDLYKLALDGSGRLERITFFNEYPAYKAWNPVVSDDGRYIAFQLAKSSEAAGIGHGILVFDLEMHEKAKMSQAKFLLEAIEKACEARKVPPGHGHTVLPVAQAILKIKDRIPEVAEADAMLVQIAALLHDIGGGGPPGESKGPPIAKTILSEQKCDPAMIERVCRIIATHHHLKGELDVPAAERPEWLLVIVADRPEVIQRYEAAPADADSLERDVKAWIAKLNRDIHWTAPAGDRPQQNK